MQPDETLATTAAPTLIHQLTSITERLDVATVFAVNKPLEVELGSGDGSFLVNYAKLHPEQNFLGVERLLGRLRKLGRKGLRAKLANLRALRIESAYFDCWSICCRGRRCPRCTFIFRTRGRSESIARIV